MSRNFHQAKNYQWRQDKEVGSIICYDSDATLFHVYDEGGDNNMLNAYFAGLESGRKEGRAEAQREMRQAIGLKE